MILTSEVYTLVIVMRLLLLALAALLIITACSSCGVLQQPANCFGPPSPAVIQQQHDLAAKLISTP